MFNAIFPPDVQAKLDAGKYVLVKTKAGEFLPIARDIMTGKFASNARIIETANNIPLDPLIAPNQFSSLLGQITPNMESITSASKNIIGKIADFIPQVTQFVPDSITDGIQIIQTHRGFQKTYRMLDEGFNRTSLMLDTLQKNVGILQSTTTLIGLGTATGVVLTAVNLYQTIKLRQEIKDLEKDLKNGFLDLKIILHDQENEILQRIDSVARDNIYDRHKTIMSEAYELYKQELRRLKTSLKLTSINQRNGDIGLVRSALDKVLASYNNGELFQNTNLAGKLRRKECAWSIEQTIAFTYQFQGEFDAVIEAIKQLQQKIRQESLQLLDSCQTVDDLDFLSPEILRLNTHDILALELWKNNLEFTRSLSPAEQQELANLEAETTEEAPAEVQIIEPLPEQSLYENLKQKSHFHSLRDQVKFLIDRSQRKSHEEYITRQAVNSEYKALAPSNWEEVPDFTVANLYWFFKNRAS